MATGHANEPGETISSANANDVQIASEAVSERRDIDENGATELAHKAPGIEEETVSAPAMVSYFRLFSLADKYDYFLMCLGTVGAVGHGLALPIFLLFFGTLINGVGDGDVGSVNKYSLYMFYLGLATWFTAWLEVACWMQTGERQSGRLRIRYLQSLLRQDVAYFDKAETGGLVDSIASDPILVQDAISEKLGTFLHYTATFFGGFGVAFGKEWRIALVTLSVLPLIAVAATVYAWNLTGSTVKAASAYAEAGSFAGEAIAQVRTVYSFVGESRVARAYSNALRKTLRLGAKAGLSKGLGLGLTYATMYSCWGLLLWYGGVLVRNGEVDGGTALASIFAVIIGGLGLGQAIPNISAFAKGRGAAFKIFRLIDYKLPVTNRDEGSETLEFVQGSIELRSVDFAYPSRPEVPIFKNFSLVIPPGKTVAIVGSSGCGKSTVVSLIERFYEPLTGELLLDGHNMKMLNLKWLRGQMGLVNQEPVLFATSVAANISYGKDTATHTEIQEAAKAANANTFIDKLPLGYETQVGERGVQLSGGQKQRVAIARAVLRNPAILLLDEATSALDAESEKVVQEALDRIMVGRTTIVVAHRLSTIRNADSIAVMQQGQIVEKGTHHELISKENGAYSALVRLQELVTTKEGSMTRNSSVSHQYRLKRVTGELRSRSGSLSNRSRRFSLSMRSVDSENGNQAVPTDDNTELLVESQGSFMRLIALTKDDWIYAVSGLIGSILAGCLNPIYAFNIGSVLTAYYSSDNHMKKEVAKYSLVFVGVGCCAPLIFTLQYYCLGIWSEKLVKRVREKMFSTILRNELGWFDRDENNSNRILARLSSDATNVRAAVGDRISVLLQNVTLILVAFILSLILQWKLALVLAVAFPLVATAACTQAWGQRGFAGDLRKAHARASQVAGEAVANIRTVAAFNAEDKVESLVSDELEGPMKRSFYKGQISGFGYGVAQFLLFGTFALGLWYASRLVNHGAGFGNVMKVFFVMIISAFSTAEILAMTPDLIKGGEAVKSVFQVLDRQTNVDPESPSGTQIDKVNGDIELTHVTFAYPSRPNVIIFKDLNLRISSGQSLAIVGPSGSGKSSVIALIERFYDPISGRVLIDGIDLKNYHLKSIRQHIGLVLQEPALFATTIYENILYGKEGASEAEVIEAAKAANAHNFISSLPDGYQTDAGERGVQLSGGQKQRIAIARAVLKDPTILLLDEATSALDAESEKIVQAALDRLMKGRTSVLVAHRLSTIRGANSIAVLQDGVILEEGSHTDLLAKGGGYARLINLQTESHQSQSSVEL